MSKALEALKSLRCAVSLGLGTQYEEMNNKCDIIEIALKRLEKIESVMPIDKPELLKESIDIVNKKLKALEIIANITKHTTHFRLKERQNLREDEMSYYLVIGYGMSECEYKLNGKEEYNLLKEVLL